MEPNINNDDDDILELLAPNENDDFFDVDHSDSEIEDADGAYSDHDSESEESGDEIPQGNRPVAPVSPLVYNGRDGTEWNVHPPHPARVQNEIIRLPQLTSIGRRGTAPLSAWKILFPDEMINIIVRYTNQKLADVRPRYQHQTRISNTDAVEIRALFGLLFMAGLCHQAHGHVSDMWRSDSYGVEYFRLVMSEWRFRLLLRCLRFDDASSREERRSIDKLAAIRDIFTQFVENSQSAYIPSNLLSCDEMLVKFKGRCSFKTFIPSKRSRYGIKLFGLCDVRNFYTYNLEIYCGIQPPGPWRDSNRPVDVVTRMVQPIRSSEATVTMDNWFVSQEVAENLDDQNIMLVGTIRKNKTMIPPIFISTSINRPVGSSMFGFGRLGTLVSYMPKKNRFVLALSTRPQDRNDHISPAGKPGIIEYYNKTKTAVDVVDQLKSYYSVSRISNRWPLTIFYALMNIGGINSYIIFKLSSGTTMNRKQYLRSLSKELSYDYARRRLTVMQTPAHVKERIKDVFPPREREPFPDPERALPQPGRCGLCTTRQNRHTQYQCLRCEEYVCLKDHARIYCPGCLPRRSSHP